MLSNYEPFNNAEEVWFWFCNSLLARGEGFRARQDYSQVRRPLETVDIHRIIKNMKLSHQIDNRVLRVMSKWGGLGVPPTYHSRAKPSEVELWNIGIGWLHWHLHNKGIL